MLAHFNAEKFDDLKAEKDHDFAAELRSRRMRKMNVKSSAAKSASKKAEERQAKNQAAVTIRPPHTAPCYIARAARACDAIYAQALPPSCLKHAGCEGRGGAISGGRREPRRKAPAVEAG